MGRTVTLRRTETVRSPPRVRHVDELSEDALARFYDLVTSGGGSAVTDLTGFVDGEIIVFTDYYRVSLE
ncbi:hypothetical protein GCM10025298_04110 [Natronobiforma cellulositropha]